MRKISESSVPMERCKALIDNWLRASGVSEGLIFRRIWKNRSELGRGVAADVVWTAVKQYAKRIGVDHHIQGITPCRASNRCTPQVDASGRIALPAEARQRN